MAKLSDENFYQAVQPHLKAGERVRHFAYGVKEPSLWVIILLFVTILGALGIGLMTRHYVVALTDVRVIIVELRPGLFSPTFDAKEVTSYLLVELARMSVSSSLGNASTFLRIEDPSRPFEARFYRRVSPGNKPNSQAIAQCIQELRQTVQRKIAASDDPPPWMPPEPAAARPGQPPATGSTEPRPS